MHQQHWYRHIFPEKNPCLCTNGDSIDIFSLNDKWVFAQKELSSLYWWPVDHPHQGPVMFDSDIFFVVSLNNLLNKHGIDQGLNVSLSSMLHYGDVIMGAMASQITSLTIVYSTAIQTQMKENIKAPRHWPLCGEFTGDRTNGQLRGKCFHLMTSSWKGFHYPWHHKVEKWYKVKYVLWFIIYMQRNKSFIYIIKMLCFCVILD